MTFNALIRLATLTFYQPAQAMQVLRSFDLTMAQRWMVLVLAVSLSALLSGLLGFSGPEPSGDMFLALARQPLRMALMQFVAMGVFAVMIAWIGRKFGGIGRFDDALLVVAWIELILILLQIGIIAVSLILPPIAMAPLGLLAYGFAFYLILKMIQALHGFTNLLLVLMGFIGTFFALVLVFTILGQFFGIMPEIAPRDL